MNRIQLGAYLKESRNETRLTQAELGKRLKLDSKKISRLERGIQFPDEDYMHQLIQLGSTLNIHAVLNAILEIKSLENASHFTEERNTVSNAELLNEIKILRASTAACQKMLETLWDERERKAIFERIDKPTTVDSKLMSG
tara:strand:- start:143 stop:565 length:423 start_codon:yes stop_codon:yes gene_type:complete